MIRVRALTVLPDGRLASGSLDNTIRLWDSKSCTETARLEVHKSWVSTLSVLPDSDGQGWWLASGSHDKTIRLWDLKVGKEITRLEVDAPVLSLCVLPAIYGTRCCLVAGDAIGRLHWLEIVE